jgi:lipopolysaccharide export system protein LptC
MESKFSALFVLFFIVIIALSSFYLKNEVSKELSINQLKLTGSSDFFLKNFFSRQINSKGLTKFTLSGNEMKNYKHLNLTTIEIPSYVKYKNGSPESRIIGQKGEIDSYSEKIIIKENVVLTRLETRQKKALNLYTNQLDIFTKEEIVSSNLPVKIIQEPNIEISGTGMVYDNKESTIKLLKNVKVHYEKPKK